MPRGGEQFISNQSWHSAVHSHVDRHRMPVLLCVLMLAAVLARMAYVAPARRPPGAGDQVAVWLTTADGRHLLVPQPPLAFSPVSGSGQHAITVDETHTYQQVDGFGASFTDSSAWLVSTKLDTRQRNALMTNLFSPTAGIGLSFLRQPMGASDLTPPWVGEYTYDDMPSGQSDPNLAGFSIQHDTFYIIPLLRRALQLNPRIKIMGTPWSPPAWMKTSGQLEGGHLNPGSAWPYAEYFVKYVQSYRAQGVPIYAVTPQNEPEYTPVGYPGMAMTAAEQDAFVKDDLGPAFAQAGLSTKILIYDHNWGDQAGPSGYPQQILADPAAAAYVAGTAWHCYAGEPSTMARVQAMFPSKETYETECSGGGESHPGWSTAFGRTLQLLIDATRNWSRSVVAWNIALDTHNGPTLYDDPALNRGGSQACTLCRGLVTIDQKSGSVTYNGDYYGLGQVSKFTTPGAYRIASTSFGSGSIEDVAFLNPDGAKVLVVYNGASTRRAFTVRWGTDSFSYSLPSGAAATFRWSGKQNSAAVTTIDDSTQGHGPDQFHFLGSGWNHCTRCDRAGIGMYGGSDSWDNTAGDGVQVVFHGSALRLYGVVGPAHGIGAASLDGNPIQTSVDFYAPTGAGDRLVWSSGPLPRGWHTFTLRVTGARNPLATWNGVNPDRIDIVP